MLTCNIFSYDYQQGWCDIPGTVDEVKAKLRMRQEGAIKRDRAMAYSLSTQVMKLGRYFMVYSICSLLW